MKRSKKIKLGQAASFLLCILMPLLDNREASEFSGGRITGSLLSIFQDGVLLFFMAMILTLFYQRVGAVIGIAASVLCLPLYLYFVVPGLFRSVFAGEWSVPLQSYFVWDMWAMTGILTLGIAAIVSFRFYAMRQKYLP